MLRKRPVPYKIPVLEAILKRISKKHPERERVSKDLAHRKSGYRGEQSLDYYLRQLSFGHQYIFPGLRLPHSETEFFQIDSLLLTNRFYVTFEAKNVAGSLLVEEHQLQQTINEQTQAFQNPLVQAENQLFHLNNLMKDYLHIQLPHTCFVVMTNPSCIIHFDPSYRHIAAPKMIRPSAIRHKVEHFSMQYPNPVLSTEQLHRLATLLLQLDTPLRHDIFQEFHISKKDILPGLFCNDCKLLTVIRYRGRWICTRCKEENPKAPIEALIDYYYLIGNTITNRELRAFFKLNSISVATKLLVALGLPVSGQKRNRVYHLSLEKLKSLLK